MDSIACHIVPMSQSQYEGLQTQDVEAEQSHTSLELTPFIFIFFRNQDSKESVLYYICMIPLIYIVATHVITLTYVNSSHICDTLLICIVATGELLPMYCLGPKDC